jgi:hypothetical protein
MRPTLVERYKLLSNSDVVIHDIKELGGDGTRKHRRVSAVTVKQCLKVLLQWDDFGQYLWSCMGRLSKSGILLFLTLIQTLPLTKTLTPTLTLTLTLTLALTLTLTLTLTQEM